MRYDWKYIFGGAYSFFNPYEENRYVNVSNITARERGASRVIIDARENEDDKVYEFYII